jgi:nascent polypeptide-associated complex subunit alpha
MLGGIDPKQMAAMMKKMGIKTENIEASEVIIKGPKTIVITEPNVTVVDMRGQKTFQIVGRVEEKKEEANSEDIQMVMERTGAGEGEARAALEEAGGDIAEAILKLKKD